MLRKLKHGSKVIAYLYSDYSQYKHFEQYIHPEIRIQRASITDATEEYKQYGYNSSLEKAKRLRENTGDTIHVDLHGGFSEELTIRWQSDKNYVDGNAVYPELYSCKLSTCGFDTDTLSIAMKLAKQCHGWSTTPLQVVDALKALGAICVKYDKATDCHLICDHLEDAMFNLPANLRKEEEKVSA